MTWGVCRKTFLRLKSAQHWVKNEPRARNFHLRFVSIRFCYCSLLRQRRHRTGFGPRKRISASTGICRRARLAAAVCSAFAHVSGSAAEEEVVARRREEIDHLGVFPKPCLVLRASRNDHNVTLAADPLFVAEAELHFALEHPRDLLICVTVRLDMDASPDAPPYDHPLVAGENAAADFFADLLLR